MAGDVVLNDATVTFQSVVLNVNADPGIMDRLGEVLAVSQSVREELAAMTPELQRLTDEVEQTRTAQAGLITLVAGLSQQIRDHADDPAALKALADSLDQGQQEIADAVTANTPASGGGGGGTGGGTGGGGTLAATFPDRASFDAAVAAYTGPESVTVDGSNVKGGSFPSLDYFTHSADGHVDQNGPTD